MHLVGFVIKKQSTVTRWCSAGDVLQKPLLSSSAQIWQVTGQLATATQFRNELRRISVTALPLILIAASASADGCPLLPNLLLAAYRNVQRRSVLPRRKCDLRPSGMLPSTTGSKLPTFRDSLTSQPFSGYPSQSPDRTITALVRLSRPSCCTTLCP